MGYETTHLSKTPDLFFLLWGASQWVLIMFLGLQTYERLPTRADYKQFFFFHARLSGRHERIIPEPSRCILLWVTSPAVVTGFLFFFNFINFCLCLLLRFGSSAKVVHFLGSSKPWDYKYNPQTGSVLQEGSGRADQHQTSFLNQWWGIYHRSILPLCENIRNKHHQAPPAHTVRS